MLLGELETTVLETGVHHESFPISHEAGLK
jgi:hypothetical protein